VFWVALCSTALALGACGQREARWSGPDYRVPQVAVSQPSNEMRIASKAGPQSAQRYAIASAYAQQLQDAPRDYTHLEQSLGPAAPTTAPGFALEDARYFELVRKALKLNDTQLAKLRKSGALTLRLPNEPTMGSIYAALWQADLPVFITTDSILHAWHKSYDSALEGFEVRQFSPAYRELLDGVRAVMKRQLTQPSPKLRAVASRLDLYLCVAQTLLGDPNDQGSSREAVDTEPPSSVTPLLADADAVDGIVKAVYDMQVATVPAFGEVDFTQFKPRGHYTHSVPLARYFRAVMWMGRADTGFNLADAGAARAALLLGVLANASDKLPAFAKTQGAIDYFVGTSNGIPLTRVAQIVREHKLTLAQLEDDTIVNSLTAELLGSVPSSRVTSQGVLSQGHDTPVPAVFQLSSQRFTLDSFVHEKVSFDRIEARTMVSGLDVFAAMGNPEATRLLRPELENYGFSGEMFALYNTISQLPASYWQQNIYTRWFDALRSLDDAPQGPHVPALFRTQQWQRKQLNNQLASWAELRRDTILYASQVYASIMCKFPDVYLEPYPDFYDRIHDMALEAQQRLESPQLFGGFVNLMGQLSDIARRQLNDSGRNQEDAEFLKQLVKLQLTGTEGCGGPTTEWTGWYRLLYPEGDMFDFAPVVADVFTDPNSGSVLDVATTGPDLLVTAFETQSGPALFVGPVSSYREFVGGRMTDEEWKAQLAAGKVPALPAWNTLDAGKGALPAAHR
jgi:hypothetical protein